MSSLEKHDASVAVAAREISDDARSSSSGGASILIAGSGIAALVVVIVELYEAAAPAHAPAPCTTPKRRQIRCAGIAVLQSSARACIGISPSREGAHLASFIATADPIATRPQIGACVQGSSATFWPGCGDATGYCASSRAT